MYKLLVLLLVAVAASAAPLVENEEIQPVADVLLTIPQGKILGKTVGTLNPYYSFKGIPYAQPPVGSLRFRSPRPHLGWSGVLDAKEHRAECPQINTIGTSVFGEEDCLFLNVYSPNITGNYPVMFWIHGGGFRGGSGNDFFYAPENLIKRDVIVVTINYRLGFLGWFSTGDRHSQGNFGLKDSIEALHWVQDNIRYFGGDASKVTIFGESAGSVMVNALVLSPAARGLFAGGIGQSGVLLSPWGFQPNPRQIALDLGKKMNITSKTMEGMVNELRQIEDAHTFVWNTETMSQYALPRGQHPFQMSPCVEHDWVEPPVLTETPMEMLKNGRWPEVPYIMGANNREALYLAREDVVTPDIFDRFKNNPDMFVPPTWGVPPKTKESADIVENVRNMYFDGGDMETKLQYADYSSDLHFHYPTYKTVKLMAGKQSKAPIYNYFFSFDGTLNLAKGVLLLSIYPGAMHSDEIPYLFRVGGFPNPVVPGSATDRTRNRMLTMWTDFAKFGNPTPEVSSVITAKWEAVTTKQEYMHIASDLEASTEYLPERMKMWSDLDVKYGPGY